MYKREVQHGQYFVKINKRNIRIDSIDSFVKICFCILKHAVFHILIYNSTGEIFLNCNFISGTPVVFGEDSTCHCAGQCLKAGLNINGTVSYTHLSFDEQDTYSYGYAFTSADLDESIASINAILPDMLRLAEAEKTCQMLSAEIEKTRRRVNALEYVMIPQYEQLSLIHI